MDRKDALCIVLDLDEQRLRRTLVAIVYQCWEPEGLTKSVLSDILDVARG